MSYSKLGTTRINDLPELQDIDDSQVQSKLRQRHMPLNDSGMNVGPPPYMPPHHHFQPPSPQFTCLDVCKHIENCPICSKFYKNDKICYILAIIVLSLICIVLLKKVLNV